VPNQPAATRTRSAVPARVETALQRSVRLLYARHDSELPFHGWHHIRFVREKAMEFAARNGSDVRFVGCAALVHDVNYIVNRGSSAAAGRKLRMELVTAAGGSPELACRMDRLVCEAEIGVRDENISLEAQALSDADTLFKALPITPVVLAHRYLSETGVSLRGLARKIVGDQRRALDEGFYFYDRDAAANYSGWALANLTLWQCVLESLDDPVVTELLESIDATLGDRAAG
jgi:uncharacterized protein